MCTCDAFCDSPCPIHAEENRIQDERIAAESLAAPLEKIMKCKECVEAGLRSKIAITGSRQTMAGWQPYYDEDGKLHSHNPNKITSGYKCTNGHSWEETWSVPRSCCEEKKT